MCHVNIAQHLGLFELKLKMLFSTSIHLFKWIFFLFKCPRNMHPHIDISAITLHLEDKKPK